MIKSLIFNDKSIRLLGSSSYSSFINYNRRYYCSNETAKLNNNNNNTSSSSISENTKEYLRKRDQVVNAHTDQLRIAIINTSKTASVAMKKHQLDEKPQYFSLLAKMMSGVSLCSSFLKDEERFKAQIKSRNLNPFYIYAESLKVGEVRGFLQETEAIDRQYSGKVMGEDDEPPNGVFQITKTLYGAKTPIESSVELVDYSIENEFALYFFLSEQIPSAIKLETRIGKDNNDCFSGGILVQTMPGTPDNIIQDVRNRIRDLSIEKELFQNSKTLEDIIQLIKPESDTSPLVIIGRTLVDFYCRCNITTFKNHIMSLGLHEVKSMKQDNHNEIRCYSCNTIHKLTDKDFSDMINILENKQE
ncbi:hypothetical protein DFA_08050 [Cavenderia fasciculata]|uniref:Uncharacterized protein n=1 Tax=Cavenderia fasciculata TaxID=261658 RepID=F4Q4W2_CACFS|nr:uncharacterized protein DFA_08050 [Cavenderia fasciculata]EGG17068.1 hypothetical protein DFA_08050 [Cavenderia fasciculata]|eukprot:XP_004355552.1 hypothetical protein DFA_08050 [Cavenderia fasciculata]